MLSSSSSVFNSQPSLEITAPEGPVQVEIDHKRNVMYVHIEGYTCLRICRFKIIELIQHNKE